MSFLAPGAFFLGLLLPLIVLMYLLKLRRLEQPVSSTYLWQRMVRDVQANSPWQRLRYNLLLLLQLLFLIFLILALARPFTWQSGVSGESAILILDTSASMAAVDISPSRLEAAKDQAHRLVNEMSDTTRLTLIEAGMRASIAAASSLDRRQLHQAIDSLQPGPGGSDLDVALQLAGAIAARQPDTQVLLLSDGQSALQQRVSLPANLSYWPIGLRGENQALSLLNLQLEPGGESLSAFIQVANYGESPAKRRLALFADQALLQVYDLELASGAEKAVLAENLPATAQVIRAQLLPPEDGQAIDDLLLDDTAYAPVRQPASRSVTLVSQGNRFLETALRLQPGIQLTLVSPTQTVTLPAADLTIFDASLPLSGAQPTTGDTPADGAQPIPVGIAFTGTQPATGEPSDAGDQPNPGEPAAADTLPAGSLLWINPTVSSEYFTVTGMLENPIPSIIVSDHPLLNHLNLETVNILDAAALLHPAWLRPLISANENGSQYPLLLAGEDAGRRIAVLAFDLRRSDLPLQVAFPILISNLLDWLAPAGSGVPDQVSPGEPVTLTAPQALSSASAGQTIASAIITRPDGSTVRLQLENGAATFAGADTLGLYQVRWETDNPDTENSAAFAANLFSPQESDTQPLQSISLAGAGSIQAGDASASLARREFWRALAFFALGVLMAEWMVYHRGALARIWQRIKKLSTR